MSLVWNESRIGGYGPIPGVNDPAGPGDPGASAEVELAQDAAADKGGRMKVAQQVGDDALLEIRQAEITVPARGIESDVSIA